MPDKTNHDPGCCRCTAGKPAPIHALLRTAAVPDEQEALNTIVDLINDYFGEGE